jgi:hypothetical protein
MLESHARALALNLSSTSKRRVKGTRRRKDMKRKSFPKPLTLEISVHAENPSDIKDGLRAAIKEARRMLSDGVRGDTMENVIGTTVTKDKTRHNSAFVTCLRKLTM